MEDIYMERRRRTLTDEDIKAIASVIHACQCASFTSEEIRDIKAIVKPMKDLADVMRETRSIVLKAVVGALLGGLFIVLALGLKVWASK